MPGSTPSILSSFFAQFIDRPVEFYASVTHPLFLLFISFRSHHYFIQTCLDFLYNFSFQAFFNVCAKSLDPVEGENVSYIKSQTLACLELCLLEKHRKRDSCHSGFWEGRVDRKLLATMDNLGGPCLEIE